MGFLVEFSDFAKAYPLLWFMYIVMLFHLVNCIYVLSRIIYQDIYWWRIFKRNQQSKQIYFKQFTQRTEARTTRR